MRHKKAVCQGDKTVEQMRELIERVQKEEKLKLLVTDQEERELILESKHQERKR